MVNVSINRTLLNASNNRVSNYMKQELTKLGTSLVAQWIRLCAPNAGCLGSIPGQGIRSHMHATTKSSHATTKEPACHN